MMSFGLTAMLSCGRWAETAADRSISAVLNSPVASMTAPSTGIIPHSARRVTRTFDPASCRRPPASDSISRRDLASLDLVHTRRVDCAHY